MSSRSAASRALLAVVLGGCLLVTSAPGHSVTACAAPNRYPAPSPSRPRYLLHVRLRPAARLATGDLRVRFTPDLKTDRLVFRLWPNSPVSLQEGAQLSVTDVRSDRGRLVLSRPDPTTLVARPHVPLPAGQPIVVTLQWRLRLPYRTRDRNDAASDSIRLGSFFPILAWEPGRGWARDPAPHMLAEASTSPTADFDLRITAPEQLRVFASGAEAEPGHWIARAVRDVAVVAGHYKVASRTLSLPNPVRLTVAVQSAGGGPVPDSSRPFAQSGSAQEFLSVGANALRKLVRLFGPYPWSTFTAVVERDVSPTGGIEYPTLVYLGYESLITAVGHEFAHQWFYSLVGNDQGRDPWLDEGLATWAQTEVNPGAKSYFLNAPLPAAARHHLGAPISYWNHHVAEYSLGVYSQGAQALAALGPSSTVDCAIRTYVARNAYRIATQADLIRDLTSVIPSARRVLVRYGAG
jgi:Peptidase family M1 domain